MRLNKNAERLSKVIEADRLNAGAFTGELIVSDLKLLLNDYFELLNSPTIEVLSAENGYKIIINACATQIKSFKRID